MKERPILFSGPMVRAILEGRKTQTRRVVKPQPIWVADPGVPFKTPDADPFAIIKCPYGQPGDRLWVKETWAAWSSVDDPEADEVDGTAQELAEMGITKAHLAYRADPKFHADRWRPSIYMPRWASRITLEIVSVRVERLLDISEKDAMAEGVEALGDLWRNYLPLKMAIEYQTVELPRESYRSLWESINGPGSWEENPWVWVVEFKEVKP